MATFTNLSKTIESTSTIFGVAIFGVDLFTGLSGYPSWADLSKNSATIANQTKNSVIISNQTKHSASMSVQNKHSSTPVNLIKS